MKEIEQHLKRGDKTVIVKQKQKEFQHLLIGKIVPQNGHTVYEINRFTKAIMPARYITEAIKFEDAANGITSATHTIITEDDCIYIPALNCENALRKYDKNHNQESYYKKEPPATLSDHFI